MIVAISRRRELQPVSLPQSTVSCHTSGMPGAPCSARLRNGDPCRSVATHDGFCAYHAALAEELGHDLVANGDQTKKRNARQRKPVIAESEPLELNQRSTVGNQLLGFLGQMPLDTAMRYEAERRSGGAVGRRTGTSARACAQTPEIARNPTE